MKLISHRGNINGKSKKENSMEYILCTLEKGYDVEVDIWYVNGCWFLGHDNPQYKTNLDFIYTKGLWIHAKNIDAFDQLCDLYKSNYINFFWHDKDLYTLTSNGYIWAYPTQWQFLTKNSIAVLPESVNADIKSIKHVYGICSDFIDNVKSEINKA